MFIKFMNGSVSNKNKGAWMQRISVFLCVILLTQGIVLPANASGAQEPGAEGNSARLVSQNAYVRGGAANGRQEPDGKQWSAGEEPEDGQRETVGTRELLSEEPEDGEGAYAEEEIVLPELRYDFCEIDDSGIAERTIAPEVLASSYLSPEAAGVSGNTAVYNPVANMPQLLSPVRNQNPTDTCWAFSTIGAMELSAIRQGIRTAEQSYSPYHMAYFLYHHVTDPLGGTAGDSNTALEGSDPRFLNVGGNLFMALFQAANWIGPVDEGVAPFDTWKETGEALADSLSYENDGVLENGYMLSTGDNMNLEIKQSVVSCGGVAVMFNASSAYRNSDTSAFYCDKAGTNHAVVIVGWDDDYSADNFLAAHRPDAPGAWIVKNSWGTGSGIGGYYYLSYEDQSIAFPIAVEMMKSGTYDNNYHYDGSLAATAASTVSVNSGGSLANIFTAHASEENHDESLEAVSIAVQSTDISYELSIYRNLQEQTDEEGVEKLLPNYGLLAHQQTGELGMAGIYTIPLTEPVVLEGGETFSVVFRLMSQDNSPIYVWTEKDYSYGWCSGTADIQKGQSFRKYASNYTWFDLYNKNSTTNTFRNLARIKAFTNTLDTIGTYDITKYTCSISQKSYVADGTAKRPEVTVTRGEQQLVLGKNYAVAYKSNVGSGHASVVVTGLSPYYGSITIPFRIYAYTPEECPEHSYEDGECIYCGVTLREQALVLSADMGTELAAGDNASAYTVKKTYLDAPFRLSVSGNEGAVTFEADDPQVLKVDEDGTVTIVGTGTAQILVNAAQTKDYAKAEFTVTVNVAKAGLGRAELSETSFYYDRTAKTPAVSVYDTKGNLLSEFRDYAISYADNINTGTATVRIIGTGNYSGELTQRFIILLRPQETCTHKYENGSCIYCGYEKQLQLLLGTSSYEKTYSDGGFTLDMYTTGDGALSYESKDPSVAEVDGRGYVTIRGTGSCYLNVKAAETDRYYTNSAQVLIEVLQASAPITVTASTITKTYGAKAFSLGAKTAGDGKLTYQSSDKKIATVSAKGKVTVKNCGKVTLTVTSAETAHYVKETKKVTLTVVPKKAALKAIKANGGGRVTVTVKKDKTVTGYQVQLAADAKFKKSVKTKKLTSASATGTAFTKLVKGKTYYCRVRSYKKVNGKTYYGAYSAVKKVKAK